MSKNRFKSLVPPIVQTSVFTFDSLSEIEGVYADEPQGYIYSRQGNPNTDMLAEAIAQREGAEAGEVFASGMAALTAAFTVLAQPGSHVIASRNIYGGTSQLLRNQLAGHGTEVSFVEGRPEEIARALRPETKVVFVETIGNPKMNLANLPKIAELCRAHGAFFLVDNTFASPALCNPLKWGADAVMHSATKYINGHGDAMGGVLVGSQQFIKEVHQQSVVLGAVLDPFAAWLIWRGMQTLDLRMQAHSRNAEQVYKFLCGQRAVERVYYPGVGEEANLAAKILPNGRGGMLSFTLNHGTVDQFMEKLKMIKFAPSLADTATTFSHPASTSHRSLSSEERSALEIDERMIRLSVGIEPLDAILEDLSRGLGTL